MAAARHFERMFPATADAVGPLRRSLRRFARDLGASSGAQARIELGFAEACVVLLPGSVDGAGDPAVLAVQASARNDAVVVRVLSRSRSLLPALDRDGYSLAVPLIAHVSDGLVIEHRQGGAGSAIAMRFELAARRGAPGARADARGARFAFPLRRVRDARSAAVGPRSRA